MKYPKKCLKTKRPTSKAICVNCGRICLMLAEEEEEEPTKMKKDIKLSLETRNGGLFQNADIIFIVGCILVVRMAGQVFANIE